METRKQFHLSRDSYVGRQIYFVTICSVERRAIFKTPQLAMDVVARLKADADSSRFLLHAWCLMPDHLHLLAEGISDRTNLFSFIRRFKHTTTAEWGGGARADKSDRPLQRPRQGTKGPGSLWQRNFYEHIVRNREHLPRVASYIWMNPVRKGMCTSVEDYPFSGSLTHRWKQAKVSPTVWVPPWKV